MNSNSYLKKRELIRTIILLQIRRQIYLMIFTAQVKKMNVLPIYLQMPNGELSELSRSSDIVDAISGKRRTDHKIYFPEDILEAGKDKNPLYSQILHMLKG